MKFSVILCTHNPNRGYLRRTLESLKSQNFEISDWELLLIDNQSEPPVSDSICLDWHPNGQILVESQLGLTPARLRGIAEAQADLLLFVDDDNVLSEDYLQLASKIASEYPFLGAFGGSSVGEFAAEVPDWFRPYLSFVGVREVPKVLWGNQYYQYKITPIGAGLVIRSEVADYYAKLVEQDPARRDLDRKGDSLISGGDTDMANCSIDLGMGVGVFPDLSLIHLISEGRLELSYIKRLAKAIGASQVIARHFRPQNTEQLQIPKGWKIFIELLKDFKGGTERRQIRRSLRQGRVYGLELLRNLKK